MNSSGKKRGTLGLLIMGIILGIILWGGFNTAMEATNTETFCISCHEMDVNVYEELQETIHFSNRTGVRATCPDCHVPKEWHHKVVRKIQATNELFHKVMGTIDTPEKFESHRWVMANRVWDTMKATDVQPSRLARAKHKLRDLLALRHGNATGLVVYSGSAHNAMPLTRDERIIPSMLEELTPDLMPLDGDALVDGLELARRMLQSAGMPGSVLVVTDGVARPQVLLADELQCVGNRLEQADGAIAEIASFLQRGSAGAGADYG